MKTPPILLVAVCLMSLLSFSQTIDVNYLAGNIIRHDKDIAHLITHHPEGLLLSYSKPTTESDAWASAYNYPDVGASLLLNNFKNKSIGVNVGVYGHYNFYFWNRKIVFRVAQGFAFSEKKYDKSENYRNVLFGSRILASTYMMLNYNHPMLWNRWGIQAGCTFIHNSNGSLKSPNKGINTVNVNVGVSYTLDSYPDKESAKLPEQIFLNKKIRYQFKISSGLNESDIIGSGQYPFFVLSASADKRLHRKSALQLGADFFVSYFLREYAKYYSIAFPEGSIKGDESFLRLGVFVGHELFVSKWSVITQAGYYAHNPIGFESDVYFRVGLKKYFNQNWFGSMSVKSHAAKAEAIEWGIGIRF